MLVLALLAGLCWTIRGRVARLARIQDGPVQVALILNLNDEEHLWRHNCLQRLHLHPAQTPLATFRASIYT
jgi:hypothetical protein